MQSNTMVKQLTWFVQGHTFSYDARVLPLKCYDLILGVDWLSDHSPQWIDWKLKLMKFPHQGKHIQLQGFTARHTNCSPINPKKVKGLIRRRGLLHCVQVWPAYTDNTIALVQNDSESTDMHKDLQAVLDQFQHLFQEPTQLLPVRAQDHHIPPIPGAKPVNVRPYRYSPLQKIEIKKQIKEMLKAGVISHSSSPFGSPVLLVKKKDGSWHFVLIIGTLMP